MFKLFKHIKAERELEKEWLGLADICAHNNCETCYMFDRETGNCRGHLALDTKKEAIEKEFGRR